MICSQNYVWRFNLECLSLDIWPLSIPIVTTLDILSHNLTSFFASHPISCATFKLSQFLCIASFIEINVGNFLSYSRRYQRDLRGLQSSNPAQIIQSTNTRASPPRRIKSKKLIWSRRCHRSCTPATKTVTSPSPHQAQQIWTRCQCLACKAKIQLKVSALNSVQLSWILNRNLLFRARPLDECSYGRAWNHAEHPSRPLRWHALHVERPRWCEYPLRASIHFSN